MFRCSNFEEKLYNHYMDNKEGEQLTQYIQWFNYFELYLCNNMNH